MRSFDACVVGGGPAGMTAALYFLRAGVSLAFVEKLAHGGQLLLTENIENYPGMPGGKQGYEVADLMFKQVKEWVNDETAMFNDEVRELVPAKTPGESHKLRIGDEWIEAKAVVLATGSRYKRLGVPGEERLIGRGVSYCALCDGNFFRDQTVAVVGGGNSALEEALYLARLVKKLYLIHRRDDFRATKCYQDRCFVHPKIQTVLSHVAEEVVGEDQVTGLKVKDLKSGESRVLEVDGVFVFIGFEPVHGFLPPEFELDAKGFVKAGPELETPVPGIYAAGDVRSKSTRQVVTATGDGAVAASAALSYLEEHKS